MKIWVPLLSVVFVVFFPLLLSATGDVEPTSVEAAAKNSPLALVAEITGTEFDQLSPGISVTSDNWYFMEIEYRVVEVLKDQTGAISPGKMLKIRLKSNANPTGSTRDVSLQDGILTCRLPGRKETYETMDVHKGKKVILFLENDLSHFGWFVSPSDRVEEILKLYEKGK